MKIFGRLVCALGIATAAGSYSYATDVPIPHIEGPLADSATQGTLVWKVDQLGYVAEEYLVSGNADIYEAVDMADSSNMLTRDNVKDMARRESYTRPVVKAAEPYVTRIIVYRPKDIGKFSGNVIVETAHPIQGGLAIVWSKLSGYFAAHGDIYVGVQHPLTFDALRQSSPVRYGKLSAADPTQLWGMIAQIGALIRSGGATSPLRGYRVDYVFLTGYSFTGVAAATFANFHHDSAKLAGRRIFDGYIPIADSMYVRPLDVPVIRIMTQSDFNSFGGLNSRREDSDASGSQFRLYEVAGASHVNASPTVEPKAAPRVPSKPIAEAPNLPHFSVGECTAAFPSGWGPNTLPLDFVTVGVFENMYRWVRGGAPPPRAARIETGVDGYAKTDQSGNAVGGMRMPEISVPAATYDVAHDACFLYGYRLPYDENKLKQLYGSREKYAASVKASADSLVAGRWLRPQEGSAIVANSQWLKRE